MADRDDTIVERTAGVSALAEALEAPVGAPVRDRARRHVLDWLGCAYGGGGEPVAQGLGRFAAAAEAGACAAVLGGRRLGIDAALTVNGALGNVLEMDDVHRTAVLHPGPVVVPTALALGAARGADLGAVLTAVVRGYEAMIRIGGALGPRHYRYFHPTATCGGAGAAAAAASLLGLDAGRTAHALANALSVAGGLWQMRHEAVDTKQIHTAHAALTGLRSAELAAAGLTGPSRILEGVQGLFAATAPGADPAAVTAAPPGDGEDTDWSIFSVSFKPWPACRHAHPAIDAALELRGAVAGRPVAAADLETYGDALAFCDRPAPRTALEAKFSLQHCVAVALARGAPGLADFAPAAIADRAVAALRERVAVTEDAAITAAYPAHYGAALHVRLEDGSTLETRLADTRGDPERPLGEDGLIAKARALMAHGGLAGAPAERLVDACLSLPEDAPLGALTGAMP